MSRQKSLGPIDGITLSAAIYSGHSPPRDSAGCLGSVVRLIYKSGHILPTSSQKRRIDYTEHQIFGAVKLGFKICLRCGIRSLRITFLTSDYNT
jgi:hypothetical protein